MADPTSAWKPVDESAAPGGWTPVEEPAASPATPQQPSGVMSTISDVLKGVGKSGLSTLQSIDEGVHHVLPSSIANFMSPQSSIDYEKQHGQANNTAQSIGKGLGSAAQFLIPGGAEEAGAGAIARIAPKIAPIAKMGMAALGSGAVNAAQGGSFGTGAAMGGIGSGIGQGMQALAPKIAESALNIRKLDRAYGKTPGQAIINETKGFSPARIAESAQGRLNELTPQLQSMARQADTRPIRTIRGQLQSPQYDIPLNRPGFRGTNRGGLFDAETNTSPVPGVDASPRSAYRPASEGGIIDDPGYVSGSEHPELSGRAIPSRGVLRTRDESIAREAGVPFEPSAPPVPYAGASLSPARGVLGEAAGKATAQNEPTAFGQLKPMLGHLSQNQITGERIPNIVSAENLLNLKRGFGNEFIHRWNPETMTGVKSTAAKTYNAMDNEFDRVVPGAQQLNQRISSLIPVAKRAESLELNAPTAQKIMGRVAAHTGALAGAGIGGATGYQHGGIMGGLVGATLGVAAPELLATPTAQMVVARGLASPGAQKVIPLIRGLGLQADRDSTGR
jgi:hypothetical protein